MTQVSQWSATISPRSRASRMWRAGLSKLGPSVEKTWWSSWWVIKLMMRKSGKWVQMRAKVKPRNSKCNLLRQVPKLESMSRDSSRHWLQRCQEWMEAQRIQAQRQMQMHKATKHSNWARVPLSQQKRMLLIRTPLPSHVDVADIYLWDMKVWEWMCLLSNFGLKGLS